MCRQAGQGGQRDWGSGRRAGRDELALTGGPCLSAEWCLRWAAGKERGAGRGKRGGPDWFELLGWVWVFYWAGFFSGFLLSFPFSISNTTQIYFEFKRNFNSNPKHSTK